MIQIKAIKNVYDIKIIFILSLTHYIIIFKKIFLYYIRTRHPISEVDKKIK